MPHANRDNLLLWTTCDFYFFTCLIVLPQTSGIRFDRIVWGRSKLSWASLIGACWIIGEYANNAKTLQFFAWSISLTLMDAIISPQAKSTLASACYNNGKCFQVQYSSAVIQTHCIQGIHQGPSARGLAGDGELSLRWPSYCLLCRVIKSYDICQHPWQKQHSLVTCK